MKELDYEKLGLKVGLELHQQLDTHKLFCNCPSILRNDQPDVLIKRKLHAVAGESGEVDIAAKHEAEKDKEFIYEGYSDTNCLLEYDECPPYPINREALQTVLHIALLLNCEILPISQIMRKTVVDGSNTSGFQRTVLIARDGYVETENGRVRIGSIYLEEDAARIMGKKKGRKIFRLDRLGIPLVEIQTEPDIKTPEQAKEVALYIGDVLRSCRIKRGLGTIRQDINVSIKGHPRVEIKGFQDVKMFIPTIEKEIIRQGENIKKKKLKSEVRNALEDGSTEFLRPMPGRSRLYPETDEELLRVIRQIINDAKKTLPRLRSQIQEELVKRGLVIEQVKILLKKDMLEEFKTFLKLVDEPKFIYQALVEIPMEIASHENKNLDEVLTIDVIHDIVEAVSKGEIEKSDVKHVMEEVVSGKSVEEALKIEKAEVSDVESEIAKLIKEKPGLSMGAYMGIIMSKFKGKISGKEVSEILKRLMR
jgi:Glu-tRNA(Gln) amidotransferase subunit E-like FAD-binding protein